MKKIWDTESASREISAGKNSISTRISCSAALARAACAPFFKERRVVFANATNFHRKFGGTRRARVPDRRHNYLRVLIVALIFCATEAGRGE
jgi:hypothetical protein